MAAFALSRVTVGEVARFMPFYLQGKLEEDPGLAVSVQVNTPEAARLTFDHVAQDLFDDLIDNYFKFYKQVTDDPAAREHFFDWLFSQYLSGNQEKGAG